MCGSGGNSSGGSNSGGNAPGQGGIGGTVGIGSGLGGSWSGVGNNAPQSNGISGADGQGNPSAGGWGTTSSGGWGWGGAQTSNQNSGVSGADGQGNVSAGSWGPTTTGGWGWSSNPQSNVSSDPGSSFGSVGHGDSSTTSRAARATVDQQRAASWDKASIQPFTAAHRAYLARPDINVGVPKSTWGEVDAVNEYNAGVHRALNRAEALNPANPNYTSVTDMLATGMQPHEVIAVINTQIKSAAQRDKDAKKAEAETAFRKNTPQFGYSMADFQNLAKLSAAYDTYNAGALAEMGITAPQSWSALPAQTITQEIARNLGLTDVTDYYGMDEAQFNTEQKGTAVRDDQGNLVPSWSIAAQPIAAALQMQQMAPRIGMAVAQNMDPTTTTGLMSGFGAYAVTDAGLSKLSNPAYNRGTVDSLGSSLGIGALSSLTGMPAGLGSLASLGSWASDAYGLSAAGIGPRANAYSEATDDGRFDGTTPSNGGNSDAAYLAQYVPTAAPALTTTLFPSKPYSRYSGPVVLPSQNLFPTLYS